MLLGRHATKGWLHGLEEVSRLQEICFDEISGFGSERIAGCKEQTLALSGLAGNLAGTIDHFNNVLAKSRQRGTTRILRCSGGSEQL